jgi:excisionase family DNA binding protein
MSRTSELMDVDDVAKALRVSPYTVRRWATQKKLHRIKLGSRTVFDADDVARFVEQARKASSQSLVETGK